LQTVGSVCCEENVATGLFLFNSEILKLQRPVIF